MNIVICETFKEMTQWTFKYICIYVTIGANDKLEALVMNMPKILEPDWKIITYNLVIHEHGKT